MKSKIALFIAIVVLICMTAAWSQNADPALLVTVEHEFAEAVAAHGVNAGFRQFLAPDGVIFRPGPVNGLEYLKDKPESKARLTWEPEHVEMTAGGDYGWTTGPWELSADSTQPPSLFGQYLSIWQCQPDSSYKLVLDVGIVYPERRAPHDVGFVTLTGGMDHPYAAELLKGECDHLTDLDRVWMGSATAPDVLLLRTGLSPVVGADAFSDYKDAHPGSATRSSAFAAVSAHGDFGYTYGTGTFLPEGSDPDESEPFAYVSLWKRNYKHAWWLAADITTPLPQ